MQLGRERIIEAAVELFNKKGYMGTSVQDIAVKLGFTKAALYYYFQRKEEILWEIVDRSMCTAERRMQEIAGQEMPVVERIKQIIFNQIMNVKDDAPYMTIFFYDNIHLPPEKLKIINSRRRNYEKSIAAVIQQGIEEGVLEPVDALLTVYGILGMCNWIIHWYDPSGPCKPEEIAELNARIILRGILKEKE
ncbi:MAG: TetR/AcrR family transcriptional regulator [Desulfotomaculaceae bacterium]|nr:TetR/AcrR family transcriptional regulator [Desulfotomaculaceae bacterium]